MEAQNVDGEEERDLGILEAEEMAVAPTVEAWK